ncbi:MAG TPA: RsmD family RNA methyltransferase [Salinimicrobium sp.]|nr:RsmD family RNA methyltransferase [Salinimicrobium sp.]
MRIVSGIHKGRRITAPKKLPVRPTTDFAKEGLFNILHHRYRLSNLEVLDLFSGTGNIAYEFGSRGAKSITAVDAHAACIKFISKTSEELDLPIMPVKTDAFKFLDATAATFDIIFADPPYNFDQEMLQKLANLVFERNLLKEDGALIIEHHKKLDLSETDHFSEARKYGNSMFSFFR